MPDKLFKKKNVVIKVINPTPDKIEQLKKEGYNEYKGKSADDENN